LIFACAKWDQIANRLASSPYGAALALALLSSPSLWATLPGVSVLPWESEEQSRTVLAPARVVRLHLPVFITDCATNDFFSKTAFVHSLWLPRRRESLSTGYKSSIRPAGQTVFCVCRDVNQIDGCATSSWGRAGGVHFLSDGCRARRGQAWCRSP